MAETKAAPKGRSDTHISPADTQKATVQLIMQKLENEPKPKVQRPFEGIVLQPRIS